MSKIAALAAKRRQKENENREPPTTNTEKSVDDPASSLSKLRISTKHTPDCAKEGPLLPRQNLQPKARSRRPQELPPAENTSSPRNQQEKTRTKDETDPPNDFQAVGDVADLRAKPSLFARILVDSHDVSSDIPSEACVFLPDSVISSFDFSKPSPDDVVLQAQSVKGLR